MHKRWSFWIPLGVAVGLAVALGILVDDPFGDDLSAYVGAVSTLVLVAVTTSYVVATHRMSETAEHQLEHMRSERAKEATDRLWRSYATVRQEAQSLATSVALDMTNDDISANDVPAANQSMRETASRIRSVLVDFDSAHPSLPHSVQDQAADLVGALYENASAAELFASSLHYAVEIGIRKQWPAEMKDAAAYWNSNCSLFPSWDLRWHKVADGQLVKDLEEADESFANAVRHVLGSGAVVSE